MDTISSYFDSLGLDLQSLLITAGIIVAGVFLISAFGRFIFGKKSTLVNAVSSAIGILFVYALNISLHSAGADFQKFVTPLPLITIGEEYVQLFSFSGADYTQICAQLVSLIILAFLMNLIDRVIPKGKNIIVWIFFRVLTVVLAQAAHLIVTGLLNTYLPEGFLMYAPAIILVILLLMLLTGALKFLVGLVLTTVNPLIAALYTFFFANVIGKQVTKAMLTTAILIGLVLILQKMGVFAISVASAALAAYIPLIILLLVLWYIVGKLL